MSCLSEFWRRLCRNRELYLKVDFSKSHAYRACGNGLKCKYGSIVWTGAAIRFAGINSLCVISVKRVFLGKLRGFLRCHSTYIYMKFIEFVC